MTMMIFKINLKEKEGKFCIGKYAISSFLAQIADSKEIFRTSIAGLTHHRRSWSSNKKRQPDAGCGGARL